MADVLRVVTFSRGGRPVEILNLDDAVKYTRLRDTFKFTPAPSQQQTSASGRRYGGSRIVGETHANGSVSWEILVKGTTYDLAAAQIETLLSTIEDTCNCQWLEWRADGLTAARSSFFEIAGPGTWDPGYKWTEWSGATAMPATITFPVKPLAEWARPTILDDFAVDSLVDYTFDSGVVGDVSYQSATQNLGTAGTLTTERRVRHTGRGYTFMGGQASLKATPGSTISSYKAGVTLRSSSATNYVEVYVDDNATNSRLRIDTIIAGVRTNRATTNLAARVANGAFFIVRGRIEGETVIAEHFDVISNSALFSTPTTTVSYFPANGSLGLATAGSSGWSWIPQQSGARIDDFTYQPYVYRAATTPDTFELLGVPGGAPAKASIGITPSGFSFLIPRWAQIAWISKPDPVNVADGSFDNLGAAAWAVTLVAGVHAAAATSITSQAVTTGNFSPFTNRGTGSNVGEITTPATTDAGAHQQIFRRFKKGVTYTAELWFYAAAATTTVQMRLGVSGDIVSSSAVALSTTWTKHTVTWVPTATVESAYLVATQTAATASVFRIDGGSIYEGTVAPTIPSHVDGLGGVVPFGVIEAESVNASSRSNWQITTSVTGASGTVALVDATTTGAEIYSGEWDIEPSVLFPDAFLERELRLEVWGRFRLVNTLVSPTAIVSIVPRTSGPGAETFTEEYGSTGKALKVTSASIVWRTYRLGTVSVPVMPLQRPGVRLRVVFTTGTASTGSVAFDYFWIVPANARALSPSGKADDTSYPGFLSDVLSVQKIINWDLSATVETTGINRNPYPTHGLGGSLLEIPPGNTLVFVKLSDKIPDEPTTTGDENLNYTAGIAVDVIPRSRMLRSG